jgi:hypothetical protein
MPFKSLKWDQVESFETVLVRNLRRLPSLMPD